MKKQSLWLDKIDINEYKSLNEDIDTDVLVVGGGMAGITNAYLLTQAGIKTTLIEGNTLYNGVSGNTTAKISSQHSLIYDRLIKTLGTEKAEMYAQANTIAIEEISNIININNISCDYKSLPSYVFTQQDSSIDNLNKENIAAISLGINSSFVQDIDVPIDIKGAVMFHNQAQFHPVKYMSALVELIISKGGAIYENTRAQYIKQVKGNINKVILTSGKTITARQIIIASHFPFYDGLGLFFTRLYAERSYINAYKYKGVLPQGMYISAEDPVISIRSHSQEGKDYMLIGGRNHKTGENSSTIERHNQIDEAAKSIYNLENCSYRWSAQDYHTTDGVPYIGQLSSMFKGIYVATGFGKWGMTNSMISALLIKDLITNQTNEWQDLYNPSRVILKPNVVNTFIKENIHIAKELIKGKLKSKDENLVIKKDSAKIIKYDNKAYGAYRDSNGKLFIVDNTCTHLGCELQWNDAELSWDCPCHASRFNYDGSVIEGPANQPLIRHDDIITNTDTE